LSPKRQPQLCGDQALDRRYNPFGRHLTDSSLNYQVVVFDAADLAAESSFWAGVLGGTVDAEDDWHMVMVNGGPRIGVQLKPNHVPPDWPHGTPPQQIHLDLWVEDFAAAHEHVMALGAKVLKPAEEVDSAGNYQVYADPAGHPFCLCWVR
jgi:predicted enzyme related to lactoylglutathione lyase